MGRRTDTASKFIPAPADQLFAAFADPQALVKWLPPAGMCGRADVFEPREGGRYRLTLTYESAQGDVGKTSGDTDVVEGTFAEWLPGRRIVQRVQFQSDDAAFAGEMTMTWEFGAAPGGTQVTLTAREVPEGISAEDHQAGMCSTLENLAAFVSRQGSRAT